VAEPTEVRVVDANGDGLPDLGVFFASSSAQLFSAGPFDPTREGGEGALEKGRPIGDGPVGIHFVSAEGVDCLVRNIYELGEPVEMPLLSIIDVPGPQGQGAPAAEALQPTGLTSIHPNPFNPETTVGFALASPERVRLAIYDVRGTLVKLLVDRTMPAGEHRATWNGTDERGRPASSGIYFVRMNAGSYRETKKVVMLK